MKKLREIYEQLETDKETLLVEEIMNESQQLAEEYLGRHNSIIQANEFRRQFNLLQENVFPDVFNSAIKALGNSGWILDQKEMKDIPDAKGKIFFNGCKIRIKKQALFITISDNMDTDKLEVAIRLEKNLPLKKEYSFKEFSKEGVEKQIIECLQSISIKQLKK